MEKNSKKMDKILLMLIFLLILLSLVITFNKLVIQKNYQVLAETSCDPATEKCFIYICDPSGDSTCPENEDNRITYYKKISKSASSITACESTLEKNGCDTELKCLQGEPSCSYIYCDENSLNEGEKCSK